MKKLITLLLFLSFGVFAQNVVLKKGNFIVLNEGFNSNSTAQVKYDFLNLNDVPALREIPIAPSNETIYLILDTPGGSIVDGLSMIDFLLSTNREVKTITVFAASMGFQTVQALGERIITPSGTLMAHKARGGFSGEFGSKGSQLDSRYNYWLSKLDRLDNLAVKRTNGKHTLESYRALFENEYWCEGQMCVDQGFADRVAGVTCDKSLVGTTSKELNINFMGMNISVTYDLPNCPMISAINVKVTLGLGEPMDISSPEIPRSLKNIIMQNIRPSNGIGMKF